MVDRGQVLGGVLEEGIQEDAGLGVPPAVDRLLGDPGRSGDALDGQAGEAAFDEQAVGGLEHGLASALAASPAVSAVARRGCLRRLRLAGLSCSRHGDFPRPAEGALDSTQRCV
jgi:hypothetical protein